MTPVTQAPADASANRSLALAVGLGFANALWALFQWAELLLARQGAAPFCNVNETLNCTAVWDSAAAVAVHDITQVPIAGWGLIWGIAATLLPLWALMDATALGRGLSASLRVTALAGAASVAGLATASAIAGSLCLGCIGTYVLVAAWCGVVWMRTRDTGFQQAPRGIAIAGVIVAACFGLLIYPGMQTPHAPKKLELPPVASATPSPSTPTTPPAAPTPAKTTDMFVGPGTGDPARDELLDRFMATLDPQAMQAMSDLLRDYRDSKVAEVPAPRAFSFGDKNAPVKLTDWTDPLCPHCAMLHETMKEIAKSVPPGLFAVDSRHFPLDGVCNAGVQRKSEDGARCIGAKVQICMEGDAKAFEASSALFAARAQTVDAVYEALKPFRDRKKLEACVASKETDAKLQSDIQTGLALHLEGTPLLLVNGKEARPFGPLVYALILTGGADRHPAFKGLPPPRAAGVDGGDGHAHAH